MTVHPYRILIVVLPLIISGCATNELLDKVKRKDEQVVFIDHYVKGVITENHDLFVCFNGNTSDATGNLSNKDKISKYNFTLRYESRHIGGGSYVYDGILKNENIINDCEQFPTGKNILIARGLFDSSARREERIEIIDEKYPNDSIVMLNDDSEKNEHQILYILTSDSRTHMLVSLRTRYQVDGTECYICYAGFPFAIIFDIVTFPFQLIWLLSHAAGH